MFRIAVCEFVVEKGGVPERGVVVENSEGDPLLFFPMDGTTARDAHSDVHYYEPLYSEGTLVISDVARMMASPPPDMVVAAGEA